MTVLDTVDDVDIDETPPLAMRQFDTITLAELKEDLASRRSEDTTTDLPLSEIEFHLAADDPFFKISGDRIPASPTGVQAFGDFLGIPAPFFKRAGKELGVAKQGELLSWFMDASGVSAVRVGYNEHGVTSVADPERKSINPIQIVDVAQKVLGTSEGEVVRLIDTPSSFAFDVHVPMDFDRGIGGDKPAGIEVGDISAGGVSFLLDIKHNLAPETGGFVYRYECTNGQRYRDASLKIDARGNTIDEVLAELNAKADRAFKRTERQIKHFYDLRRIPVKNPERELIAMARDFGIPPRSLLILVKLARTNLLPDNPTRFDLVNLITNLANDPAIINDGGRLLLESAGGAVVQDEAARCGHCLSTVM